MMKKLILAILLIAPLAIFGQKKGGQNQPVRPLPPNPKNAVANPEVIFMELILIEVQGNFSIRPDVGRDNMANVEDKELVAQIAEMRQRVFTNVPDAMTYLQGMGFNYVDNYKLTRNDKEETHLMFEKKLIRKAPKMPTGKPEGRGGDRDGRMQGDESQGKQQEERK
jgi:hypothetical protein